MAIELVKGKAAIDIELECRSGPETPIRPFNYPFALYPSEPETYFVGVANYTNGRYLPVGDPFCRSRQFCMAGGDLPFLLVTDGQKGLSTTLLTPWDGAVQMQTRNEDADKLGFPGFRWYPAKGLWARSRKGRLSFFAKGGHVTACKIYREMAQEQGLVRTFAEKAKTKVTSEIFDPEQENKLRAMRAKVILNDLMINDPIISSAPAEDVAEAYNVISRMVPLAAQQPGILRSMLRRMIHQEQTIEPHEAQQLIGVEQQLRSMQRL